MSPSRRSARVLDGRVRIGATFVVAPAAMLARLPDNLSFEDGASLAHGGVTAAGLARHWPLERGSTAVVWGAAGSVGLLLVASLAERGVKVIGIASGPRTERVRAAGATLVIDWSTEDVGQGVGARQTVVAPPRSSIRSAPQRIAPTCSSWPTRVLDQLWAAIRGAAGDRARGPDGCRLGVRDEGTDLAPASSAATRLGVRLRSVDPRQQAAVDQWRCGPLPAGLASSRRIRRWNRTLLERCCWPSSARGIAASRSARRTS